MLNLCIRMQKASRKTVITQSCGTFYDECPNVIQAIHPKCG
ncbi:Uncharacterized protein EbC_pEb17201380 (plasmid) [Erwinia billingiae Eb661]|uniref:Uncharacterized protein n=1 Tax=Erwinia billingiae (strain Eb661) TaxID=634500 RepID=D8MJZ3_ERWBE|nr:Uncharacterized protein EbC_pEb17201380 [Erwinia billingiae Eb661]